MNAEPAATRVTVVDDHANFRAGLRRLLARTARVEVVAEADNAQLGVSQALRFRPCRAASERACTSEAPARQRR